jgi:hypothetical protein
VTASQGDGFWSTFIALWHRKQFINGPLWFAQALLMFILVYCAWRAAFGSPLSHSERKPKAVPASFWWLLSALLVGAPSLAIRQFISVGQNVLGLQLAYFATYIFLFAVGIAAWRFDWLRQLNRQNAGTGIIAMVIAMPAMPVGVQIAHTLHAVQKANFSGGFSWAAILYAFWEPFVAWGLIAAWLLVFRASMNKPSAFWNWLNRRAYAVYIIHPPVLVGLSLLLHAWLAPPLLKFATTGALTCIACWLVADPLVRLPGLRRVI